MRRSEWITVIGLGGVYLFVMYATSRTDQTPLQVPEQVAVYPDVQACLADAKPRMLCDVAQSSATKAHYANAPHYGDRATCEREVGEGNCAVVSPPFAADYFAPMMAGFVLGSALGLNDAVPIYYDRQGNARIAGGDYRLGRRCPEGGKDGCSSGGGGGGGGGGGRTTTVVKGKEWVNTAGSNLRSVSRGGFGLSVHGAGA